MKPIIPLGQSEYHNIYRGIFQHISRSNQRIELFISSPCDATFLHTNLVILCAGPPARTVGWRDPGFIHTSFLKDLWPNSKYVLFMSYNS